MGRTILLPLVQWIAALICPCVPLLAQEEFFNPIIEATPTNRHEGGRAVFSFARFEPDFRALCKGLEQDGRRERIVSIAQAGIVREKVCITCRSFWKMIVSSCAKLGPRPTPTPKPPKIKKGTTTEQPLDTATPAAESSEAASGVESASELQQATASPKVPATGARETRHPSTEVLDEASRVSSSIYALDAGDGQLAEMFRYFGKTVREDPGLSAAEREYYDIFLAYLLAAWEGRVDSTRLPPPTVGPEVDSFFE